MNDYLQAMSDYLQAEKQLERAAEQAYTEPEHDFEESDDMELSDPEFEDTDVEGTGVIGQCESCGRTIYDDEDFTVADREDMGTHPDAGKPGYIQYDDNVVVCRTECELLPPKTEFEPEVLSEFSSGFDAAKSRLNEIVDGKGLIAGRPGLSKRSIEDDHYARRVVSGKNTPDAEGGLYGKYVIHKADGSPIDPEADYFVLRPDKDPAAKVAVYAYALGCKNERLSRDLIVRYSPPQDSSIIYNEDQLRDIAGHILALCYYYDVSIIQQGPRLAVVQRRSSCDDPQDVNIVDLGI